MKYILIILLYFILNCCAFAETYDGKIVLKADLVIDANDMEVVGDNLLYKKSLKNEMDTVKLSEVDYILSNDKSYALEGAVVGLGVGAFVYLLAGDKDDIISYLAIPTIIMTLAGAALTDYKKIDISPEVSTSFLDRMKFLPQTNVFNYQLVSISFRF
ncbi:MAG: hypothetical protein RIF34_04550 [Candidatus Kapaibacterium sp.]